MTVAELTEALEAEKGLGARLDEYAGQWVGILDHNVVVSASTLGKLFEQIESQAIEDVEVLQVPADPSAACFF